MRLEDLSYDDDLPDEDSAIESVLGENPRAKELQLMISALEQRRSAALREAEKSISAGERFKLEARLAEMTIQLKVLREEEAITSFVENSVRVTINRPSSPSLDEDENIEF